METPKKRLNIIKQQLDNHVPKHSWFKKDGWGYQDTKFKINNQGLIEITGDRYLYSGKTLPSFAKWIQDVVGVDFSDHTPTQTHVQVPPPRNNQEFLQRVQEFCVVATEDDTERAFHSHGHSLQEMFILKFGRFERAVDVVVYPGCEEHVKGLVNLANELNVVLIPYGGGTNVTQALLLDSSEERTVCSVDMSKMNHVREVNLESRIAVVECGISGKELEEELSKYGMCCGHEPDSVEFSTLGGWISTRASGMKKNVYGNIDDIVITVRIVTPTGIWEKPCKGPRTSTGPDINHFIMGHEGLFGILTQASIKVKPLPETKVYDSIVFPNFDHGSKFMYECGINYVRPASIRLVDNLQFQFAIALKPAQDSQFKAFIDSVKKYFVTNIKGFDPHQMCACTLVYEGSKDQVELQQKQVNYYASKNRGMRAGPENGIRGYFLTFMIAYIRDFGMEYNLVAESFEASVPWDKLKLLLTSVPKRVEAACSGRGIKKKPFVSSRITQLYDTGACVYIYFAFFYRGMEDPVKAYSEIEEEARREIMKCGGSLSHHHGVGKLRKEFMHEAVGEPALSMLRALKQQVDPKNIFATRNLI